MSIEKYNKQYSIGLVALSLPTADGTTENTRAKKVQAGIDYLQAKGFSVTIGKTVFPEKPHGYKAASIADRVKDIHEMFSNSKINLIMNTIGGYNCNEILESLDYDLIKKNPKHFVGFSDITSANLALFTKANIPTVNGCHITYYLTDQNSFLDLFQTLNNEKKNLNPEKYIWQGDLSKTLREPGAIKFLQDKNSSAQGWAIGGNLSTFCLMLGTEYMPDFAGSILFLEYDKEEDKCLPSLERLMWQIRQNGIFKKINGLVFGQLQVEVAAEENDFDNLQRILTDVTQGYDFPVLFNTSFGHIYPCWQIVNGKEYSFTTPDSISIQII